MGRKAKKQAGNIGGNKALREISEKQEQFILDNLPLIYFFSHDLNRFGIPIEDMVQIGFEGMLKAIRDYDGKHRFSTYFRYKFIGELSRERKISYYPGPFRMPIHQSTRFTAVSLSELVFEEGNETIGDSILDQASFDQENLATLRDWSRKFIYELQRRLPAKARDRAIIVYRIGLVGSGSTSLEDVGRLFGISGERVRHIEKNFAHEIHYEMNLENEHRVEEKKAHKWIRDTIFLIRVLNEKYGWEIDFESSI